MGWPGPATSAAPYAQRDHEVALAGGRFDVVHGFEPGLPSLSYLALRDSSALVRSYAESALWVLWSRSGDRAIDALLARGVEEMNGGRLGESIATFSEAIRRRPSFTEAWNKRATAYYLAGEYRKSIADCKQVLKRNPHGGHLFVFRGRRGSLIKVLWHDGQGMCLFAKRLERGRFVWPRAEDGMAVLTPAQLSMLLEGIDWRRPARTWRPELAG